MRRYCTLALALLGLVAGSARAQRVDPAEAFAAARMHFGPLALTPTASLSNMGVDTNVFNSSDEPEKDFTTTLTPEAQFWLHVPKVRVSGAAQISYDYYASHTSERALNTQDNVRLEVPVNRVVPYVTYAFTNVRERPGYEIDVRARHVEHAIAAGTDIRVSGLTSVGIAFWRTRIGFDADARFLGSDLGEMLNRTAEGLRLSMRRNVTPLTKFVVDVETERDRFQLSPTRNADGFRIMPGLDFAPYSIISGNARVGFRRYDLLEPGRRGYKGLVTSADVGYRFLSSMRLAIHTEHDIAYSYEAAEPYYLQTGVSATLIRRITNRWDIQTSTSRYQLAYQQALVGVGSEPTDTIWTVGAGIGFTFSSGKRLGLNLVTYDRSSTGRSRDYNLLRLATSFSSGF